MQAWELVINITFFEIGVVISSINLNNHVDFVVTLLKAMYSTSGDDKDTICCLLHFQERIEPLILTIKPVTDLLV